MKSILKLVFLLVIVLFMSLQFMSAKSFQTINGLPVHVKELSPDVIRMWVGDYISSTAVSAIRTAKGIVVIDTTECPEQDKVFRKITEKHFGSKIKYLINTHEHGDHTTGNFLYRDCEIIAHQSCVDGMKNRVTDRKRVIQWFKSYIPQMEQKLKEMKAGSDKYKQQKEDITVKKMRFKSLLAKHPMQLPTKTFKESMKLDMGNKTIELLYAGGIHTTSDIFVFIPEEGMLFTGDVMADVWLTDTPGCLASFGLRPQTKKNLPLLYKNWEYLLTQKNKIKHYLPGHWNGTLSYQGFKERLAYVKTLQKEVTRAAKSEKGLRQLFVTLSLKNKFPHLVGKPGFTRDFVHNQSIMTMWQMASGQKDGTTHFQQLIESKGIDKAVTAIKKLNNGKKSKFFFLEASINGLGYRYVNQKKYKEAIEIFKLNIQFHPDSWNVYDSLGETYLKVDKKALAKKFYQEALKRNPTEQRIIDILKKIG